MSEKTDYQRRLQDPRWQRRRLEKMQEADWRCDFEDQCFVAVDLHQDTITASQ